MCLISCRTDSFSKYSQSGIRITNIDGQEEPVYSTLTRGTNPPHEAIALSHIQTDDSNENLVISESAGGTMHKQLGTPRPSAAESYQIPVSSQENLTSLAPGSVGNFQAMKRHASTASGYDSTSHLLTPLQKSHPSSSPTDMGSHVVSATNPWNDYEHIDGDDAFSPPNSASSLGDSPMVPKVHGRQQSVGSLGLRQSPRSLKQPSGALSSSVPIGINPPHNEGAAIFAVVEEDDVSQAAASYQVLNNVRPQQNAEPSAAPSQQTRRIGGNHSPSGSTGSSSPHILKQALMTEFQSAESVTQQRGRESNCSEPPPPYSSRPSSEAVMLTDSADSSMADNGTYGRVDHQQRPWYQASDMSLDSNAQSNVHPTPSPSPMKPASGRNIEPYAMIHNEQISYTQKKSSNSTVNESNARNVNQSNNQQRPGFQTKPQAQPYAEPVRSSAASLSHAQENSTFFEVVV